MRLDFSRQAFTEALLHLALWAAASSLAETSWPEIQSDTPRNSVQTVV